jgi:hypothetical protein
VPAVADPTKFKAWLSDSTHNAKDRITSDGPWYRLDGVKVADNKAALIATDTTPLFTAIAVNETGAYTTVDFPVWSGTHIDGTNIASYNCSDWGNDTSGANSRIGDADTSFYYWTWYANVTCANLAALYCFEDD